MRSLIWFFGLFFKVIFRALPGCLELSASSTKII